LVEADPNLPGTHRPEGVVALAGAGLAAGRYLNAELIDITPTILTLLDIPIPDHVEGTSIFALSRSGNPRTSYAHTRCDPAEDLPQGSYRRPFEFSSEEQAIIERRLADLGYLE
jgi:hypothetical protein